MTDGIISFTPQLEILFSTSYPHGQILIRKAHLIHQVAHQVHVLQEATS